MKGHRPTPPKPAIVLGSPRLTRHVSRETASELTVSAAEARARFADVLGAAAYRGERISITRHGKTIAAVVPADDLALLEELENTSDLRAAKLALSDAKRKGTVALASLLRQFRSRPSSA
ncbi:MAG: type II toxin-antitoxin system Phd/YefM family antitoxin [Candidatus Binataceae bacterium]